MSGLVHALPRLRTRRRRPPSLAKVWATLMVVGTLITVFGVVIHALQGDGVYIVIAPIWIYNFITARREWRSTERLERAGLAPPPPCRLQWAQVALVFFVAGLALP